MGVYRTQNDGKNTGGKPRTVAPSYPGWEGDYPPTPAKPAPEEPTRRERIVQNIRHSNEPSRASHLMTRFIDVGYGLAGAGAAFLGAWLFSKADKNSDFAPVAEAFAAGAVLPVIATVAGTTLAESIGAGRKTSHFFGAALGLGTTMLTTSIETMGENMPLIGDFIPDNTDIIGVSGAGGVMGTIGGLAITNVQWKNEPPKPRG